MSKFYYILSIIILLDLSSCAKAKAPTTITTADCPDTIKFNAQILPMVSNHCFSCHANGISPNISNYSTIYSNANKILKALRGDGLPLMPEGGPALNDTLIQQFSCWINQGKQNN